MNLTWNLSPDDGGGDNDVTGYKIYRRPVGGVFAERGTAAAGAILYFDTGGLIDGADYEYMVRAVDAAQESGALRFDGVNDYVDVPNSADLNYDRDPFTLEAWIRLAEGTPLSIADHAYPIIHKDGYSQPYYLLQLRGSASYRGIYFRIADGTFNQLLPTSDRSSLFLDYQWHHVCIVRDASTNGYMYLDGVQAGSLANMNNNTTRGGTLKIGGGAGSGYFPGSIDQVKIYKRGLSAAEVAASFSSGATPTDSLVAWWKCDAASGSTLVSETGANNGNLINFGASPSPWSVGREGNTASVTYIFFPKGTTISVR